MIGINKHVYACRVRQNYPDKTSNLCSVSLKSDIF
jgi:hypothetical protein